MFKKLAFISLGYCLLIAHLSVAYAGSTSLQKLLQDVRQFGQDDQQLNQRRESAFNRDLKQQSALLKQSKTRLLKATQRQDRLKKSFDDNDAKLAALATQLDQRAGQLGEVFGVAKQVSLELRPILSDSIVSADNPQRINQLDFAESRRVPTLQELEALWYQLQLEMTASGQIKQFDGLITDREGNLKTESIIRFGTFMATTSKGDYLNWNIDQQSMTVLRTQPSITKQKMIEEYAQGTADEVMLDPSRGQLLSLLDRMPGLMDRIHQGGEVGYLIIGLGALGLLIALWRLLVILITEIKVHRQLRNPSKILAANPLGRVLLAVKQSGAALDEQELKVDEAILHELPRIERGQNFIKLLAAVAPLMGLLGTVIGMIATFQSITLFGTSDPKLMAGGISQALMTTVLGLVVAIPLLFSYSILSTRGRRLTRILQEKSLALMADNIKADKEETLHAT